MSFQEYFKKESEFKEHVALISVGSRSKPMSVYQYYKFRSNLTTALNDKKLFDNLSDIKNIERWNLGEQQVTNKISRYFKLWENLQETYEKFQERLAFNGQAYMGMLYRKLADDTEEILIKEAPYEKYVFIGFWSYKKN